MTPQERAKVLDHINALHEEAMRLVRAGVRNDVADIQTEASSYVSTYTRIVKEILEGDDFEGDETKAEQVFVYS